MQIQMCQQNSAQEEEKEVDSNGQADVNTNDEEGGIDEQNVEVTENRENLQQAVALDILNLPVLLMMLYPMLTI